MSLLFIIENKAVKPYPETLLISPFKEIWDRDKSKDKAQAIKDFTFMEFFVSKKGSNPYKGYSDTVRKEKLKEDIMGQEDWEVDDLMVEGMKKLVEFQEEASPTYTYYMSALTAANKLKDFFDNFDINEVNVKTGNPIYKPRDITSALKDTNSVLQDMKALEEKVEQELFESTKTKGQKSVSPFAQSMQI
jgi:hypothetical protein